MTVALKKALAKFQRALSSIRSAVYWQTCIVHLEEAMVFWNDFESHIRNFDQLLTLLNKAELSVKLKNCEFFTSIGKLTLPDYEPW